MTRWGIISTGKIANDFALAIAKAGGVLEAVASRSEENAERFAKQHGFKRHYNSYEQIYADSNIDIIYIATPHSHHFECVMQALENSKNVLCEKPLCPTMWQTEKCVAKAREKNVFLMEGVWTRFFPTVREAKKVAENDLGKLVSVWSSFGFNAGNGPQTGRIFEKELAGGALLDVGVYPLNWVVMLLGEPVKVQATGTLASTGVDDFVAATLTFSCGAVAQIQAATTCTLTNDTHVTGKNGIIHVPTPSHCPDTLTTKLVPQGSNDPLLLGAVKTTTTRPLDPPHCGLAPGYNFIGSQGFVHEVLAVQSALEKGLKECAEAPLDETLIVAKVSQEIRKQIGVTYSWDQ